ncbi:MAG TPA: DNA polymerase III, subunit gamma and tau [Syntrophus sp. (in: bacteria)]|nr:DNA polymerase III, subunit gamma and tau [Syntrophus sp. (in: bacteria)]
MTYQVLARRLRPQDFASLLNQEDAKGTLTNALKNGRAAHAYLFHGPRGTGKTTVARIFAKCLNCHGGITATPCLSCLSCLEIAAGTAVDVHEIDGATYTKAEDMREIMGMVVLPPARDRFKVYIIDEVQMLSNHAFNALLKTLEEPPPHAVFVFATTEKHKIPATILSRCQVFGFHLLPVEMIKGYLGEVLKGEGLKASDAVLHRLARAGGGSVRDTLSLLDQVINLCGKELDESVVVGMLGETRVEDFARLLLMVSRQESASIVRTLRGVRERGEDLLQFFQAFVGFLRTVLSTHLQLEDDTYTEAERGEVKRCAAALSYEECLRAYNLCIENLPLVQRTEYPHLAVELLFLKLAELPKLARLEELIASGDVRRVPVGMPAAQAPPPPERKKTKKAQLIEMLEAEKAFLAGYLQDANFKESAGALEILFAPKSRRAHDRCAEKENLDCIAKAAGEIWGGAVKVTVGMDEAVQQALDTRIKKDPAIQALIRGTQATVEEVEYLSDQEDDSDEH